MNTWNTRIKAMREDRDLTQQKLTDMLHISRSAYSAYENGARRDRLYF